MDCVCGNKFSIEHALSCNRGGFPTLRHNDIRDMTASLLSEVCSNVSVEPPLQELSGESLRALANRDAGVRLDIAVDGFWGPRRERTYIDVRVFNPFAPNNRKSSLVAVYRSQEREKILLSKSGRGGIRFIYTTGVLFNWRHYKGSIHLL